MNQEEKDFVGVKLREIRRAIEAVCSKLGPNDPVAIDMARSWDFMRAGVRQALALKPIQE